MNFQKWELFSGSLCILGESKKRPTFDRPLPPEYISNDILQYLIEYLICSIIFRKLKSITPFRFCKRFSKMNPSEKP